MSWWEDIYSSGGPSMGVYAMPETIDSGLSDFSYGSAPDIAPLLDMPRSSGITVSGILGAVESTAKTGFDLFSKAYQIQDAFEGAKINRQINQGRIELQKAQASGAIEVGLSRNQAEIAIEKIRAGAAVANAEAQSKSSGNPGGYIMPTQSGGIGKFLPFVIIGFAIWKFAK